MALSSPSKSNSPRKLPAFSVFRTEALASPAKDHERQRRAGVGSNTFNVDLNSPLPSREAVMKNTHNKRGLSRLLSTFNLGCRVSVESRDDGVDGVHALSGCDTVSYPFGKGKASVLKTLKAGNFPGLFDVLGEESATHVDLMAVGQHFFAALYGQPTGTSMTQARYNLYTCKQAKPLRIMLLPPTDTNLYLHVRRAHLQMLLWKAADQQGPRDVYIAYSGWKIDNGITCLNTDSGPPGPPLLMNVISCRCRAKDKACKEGNCSCYREKLT